MREMRIGQGIPGEAMDNGTLPWTDYSADSPLQQGAECGPRRSVHGW